MYVKIYFFKFIFDLQYDDEEVDEEGQPRARAKKKKKRPTKQGIFDVSIGPLKLFTNYLIAEQEI